MKKLLLLFLLLANFSFGQSTAFITKWTFPSASTTIQFNALTTASAVNYSYTLSTGGNGTGTFTQSSKYTMQAL